MLHLTQGMAERKSLFCGTNKNQVEPQKNV